MAIDGRDIARRRTDVESGGTRTPDAGKRDAYESPVVRLVSHALVWIPLALVVGFAYVSGTWLGGGWVMGVLSVISTVLTVGILWVWYRRKRRR